MHYKLDARLTQTLFSGQKSGRKPEKSTQKSQFALELKQPGSNNRNYNQNSNTQSRRDSLRLARAFVSTAAIRIRISADKADTGKVRDY